MKKLLLLFLLLGSPLAHSQTISGFVYDAGGNYPLEGAFVYLDGTTFSATTDAKGFFKITTPHEYNTQMVVSSIGYEKFILQNPYSFKQQQVKVMLREEAENIEEVVIEKNTLFTRKQMLRAFRRQFLGTSSAGSSCSIENEEDIVLYYERGANVLHAEAKKPLRIINKRLQYNINFELADFQVSYYSQSLAEEEMSGSFYAGTTFFKDTAKKGSADKKRRQAYRGSTSHLMKAIFNNSWEKEGFDLYVDKFPIDPESCFMITDSLMYKKVTIKELAPPQLPAGVMFSAAKGEPKSLTAPKRDFTQTKYVILYNKTDQTQLTFNERRFYIDEKGLFSPLTALVFSGYMGTLRAGDLLPDDYEYKPAD